jgi:hypothetical protein
MQRNPTRCLQKQQKDSHRVGFLTDSQCSVVIRLMLRGGCDPLSPYIGEAVFDPPTIQATTTAFQAVCDPLGLIDREGPVIEIVARKVIEVISTGERDPERIRDLTLLAFKASDQRSA